MTDRDVSEDIGQLALCAFRYSLGRSAGVPAELCERIMRIEDQLPLWVKDKLCEEAAGWLGWVNDPDPHDESVVAELGLLFSKQVPRIEEYEAADD